MQCIRPLRSAIQPRHDVLCRAPAARPGSHVPVSPLAVDESAEWDMATRTIELVNLSVRFYQYRSDSPDSTSAEGGDFAPCGGGRIAAGRGLPSHGSPSDLDTLTSPQEDVRRKNRAGALDAPALFSHSTSTPARCSTRKVHSLLMQR
jgi:hypothetical protein